MLQSRAIAWLEDPSNQSSEFERPRLRAARANLDKLGLTNSMLALSAARLLRARRALDGIVDEFCSPAAGVISVDQCGLFTIDRVKLRTAEPEIALRAMSRVVAAAGGSPEPAPLGKIETLTEALQSTGAGPAKWTLARAMIAAKGETVTVGREPGRDPLPRLELTAGNRVCWDGRFWVEGAASVEGTIEVRALGETVGRQLRRDGVLATSAFPAAIEMVPSFWREGSLMAVPSLDFWSAPVWRTAFLAQFVWLATPKRLVGLGTQRKT
jgi:tRNA(Ile)-lysidine synthase